MPLRPISNTQEEEYLRKLYDEYCKIALREIMRDNKGFLPPIKVAELSHSYATAMLNERKK